MSTDTRLNVNYKVPIMGRPCAASNALSREIRKVKELIATSNVNGALNTKNWAEKQVKAFTMWCNLHLRSYNMNIEELAIDFQDGIKLYTLVSHLSRRQQEKYNEKPTHKLSKIGNLFLVFKTLSLEEVKIVNISCEDIYDGNLKLISGLIWTLIQHYQIGSLRLELGLKSSSLITDRQVITDHLIIKLSLPPNKIIDFRTDFNDGILLSGLVNSIAPNTIIHWQALNPINATENVTKAINTAEEYLNVPRMIEVEELVESKCDSKVLITYLSSIMLSSPVKPLPVLEKTTEETEYITSNKMSDLNLNVEDLTSSYYQMKDRVMADICDENITYSQASVSEGTKLQLILEEDEDPITLPDKNTSYSSKSLISPKEQYYTYKDYSHIEAETDSISSGEKDDNLQKETVQYEKTGTAKSYEKVRETYYESYKTHGFQELDPTKFKKQYSTEKDSLMTTSNISENISEENKICITSLPEIDIIPMEKYSEEKESDESKIEKTNILKKYVTCKSTESLLPGKQILETSGKMEKITEIEACEDISKVKKAETILLEPKKLELEPIFQCTGLEKKEKKYEAIVFETQKPKIEHFIQFVDFENREHIIKCSNGYILVDFNQSTFNETNTPILKLTRELDSNRDIKSFELDMKLGEKCIGEAKIKDFPTGTYAVSVKFSSTEIVKLPKNIIIDNNYVAKIRTIFFNDSFYESLPISIMFDTSDFATCDIRLSILGPVADKIMYFNYSKNLIFCTFIPQCDGEYKILYSKDGGMISNSTFSIQVESMEKHCITRPLPIFVTPYEKNKFQSVYIPYILSYSKKCLYQNKLELEEKDLIKAEIIYNNGECKYICDAAYHSKDQLSLQINQIPHGLYILNAVISKSDGKNIHLNCQPILVEKYTLKFGIESTICFKDKDSLDLKKIKYYDDSNLVVPFEKEKVENTYISCNKIKFVPLRQGSLTLTLKNKISKISKVYQFEVEGRKESEDWAVANEKYIKRIKLIKLGYVKEKFRIDIFDPDYVKVQNKFKILKDTLCVSFVPSRSGIFLLKIKYNELNFSNSPYEIFVGVQSSGVCTETCLSYLKLKDYNGQDFAIFTQKVNGSCRTKILHNVCDDENMDHFLKVVWTCEEPGFYRFETVPFSFPVTLSPESFYVQPLPKYICKLNEKTTLCIPFSELELMDIPQNVECKAKQYGKVFLSKLIILYFKVDRKTSEVHITFEPNISGIAFLDPKVNKIAVFKNPIKIFVKNPPYGTIHLNKNWYALDSNKSKIFVKLADLENLGFYDQCGLDGLSIHLMDHESNTIKCELLHTQKNQLGFFMPKTNKPEKYRIILAKNNDLIDTFKDQIRAIQSDTNGHVKNFKIKKICSDENKPFVVSINDQKTKYPVDIKDGKLSLRNAINKCGLYKIIFFHDGNKCERYLIIYSFLIARKINLILSDPSEKNILEHSQILIQNSKGREIKSKFHKTVQNNILIESKINCSENHQIILTKPLGGLEKFDVLYEADENKELVVGEINKNIELEIDRLKKFQGYSLEKLNSHTTIIGFVDYNQEDISAKIVKVLQNKIVISFFPKKIGQYFICLREKYSEKLCLSKIYSIFIKGDCSKEYENFVISGNGLINGIVNKKNTFYITGNELLQAKKLEISCDVKEMCFNKKIEGSNAIKVTYIPEFFGQININIIIGKRHILRSPYAVRIWDSFENPFGEKISFIPLKEIILYIKSDLKNIKQDLTYSLCDSSNTIIDTKVSTIIYKFKIQINSYDEKQNKSSISVFFYVKRHGLHTLIFKNIKTGKIIEDGTKIFYVNAWYSVRTGIKVIGYALDRATVDQSNRFLIIENLENENSEYKLEIRGPELCNYLINRLTNNRVMVDWKPSISGNYSIILEHISKGIIKGFPLKVEAKTQIDWDKTKCQSVQIYTNGNGLRNALINHPNYFQIISCVVDTQKVNVTFQGNTDVPFEKMHWRDGSKNVTTISYTPKEIGSYTIILSCNNNTISGSPFIVQATDEALNKNKIQCSLDKKFKARCHKINEFFIDASNSNSSDINVIIESKDRKISIKPEMVDMGAKIYSVQFQIDHQQDYSVVITDKGFNIPG
ncbi:hypothetical protein HZS_2734, partial [Henneguya salminicola]